MAVNAKTEMFDHIELFGKPALFTNFRIDRSTVPENWYCYDFRGSDSDPGKLNYAGDLRRKDHHTGEDHRRHGRHRREAVSQQLPVARRVVLAVVVADQRLTAL